MLEKANHGCSRQCLRVCKPWKDALTSYEFRSVWSTLVCRARRGKPLPTVAMLKKFIANTHGGVRRLIVADMPSNQLNNQQLLTLLIGCQKLESLAILSGDMSGKGLEVPRKTQLLSCLKRLAFVSVMDEVRLGWHIFPHGLIHNAAESLVDLDIQGIPRDWGCRKGDQNAIPPMPRLKYLRLEGNPVADEPYDMLNLVGYLNADS